MTFNKFLVLKWDWIEEALTDDELNTFYGLISAVTENKPEYTYHVVNSDEPYADVVEDLIKRKYRPEGDKGKGSVTRFELLKGLRELKGDYCDVDVEAGHAEADELLVRYINDPEVEKAFEEVPKWYG